MAVGVMKPTLARISIIERYGVAGTELRVLERSYHWNGQNKRAVLGARDILTDNGQFVSVGDVIAYGPWRLLIESYDWHRDTFVVRKVGPREGALRQWWRRLARIMTVIIAKFRIDTQ